MKAAELEGLEAMFARWERRIEGMTRRVVREELDRRSTSAGEPAGAEDAALAAAAESAAQHVARARAATRARKGRP